MPKREAKKSRAQEDREREEQAKAEEEAAPTGKKKEPEADDDDEPAKPAPAAFDPPAREPAKAADEGEEDEGSNDGSGDEDGAEEPKAAEAEAAPSKVSPPANMAEYYKEILKGSGFKGHEEYAEIKGPATVDYCHVCSLPPDFCIWGPCWDKCKPVCMEMFLYLYPELAGGDCGEAKQKAQAADEKAKVKELPGGKKTRAKSPEVLIRKLTRGGRKCVTSIAGLEGFGVKPEAAAKLFKKKFACGSAPVKGEPGQPDTVDIQGDFEDEVIQLIVENFKEIPKKKISVVEGGKVKGRK